MKKGGFIVSQSSLLKARLRVQIDDIKEIRQSAGSNIQKSGKTTLPAQFHSLKPLFARGLPNAGCRAVPVRRPVLAGVNDPGYSELG
jgi:hypothetical protein